MLKIEKTEVSGWETATRIPNHYGYYATRDGQIIGKRKKQMIGSINRDGYREVILSHYGVGKPYRVHRLIAETFLPNPNKLPFVNHKDGNKLNCNVDNLEWCTRSENAIHSFRTGLQTKVTNPYGTYRVLTEDEINTIKKLHCEDKLLDREIAIRLGCSRSLVSRKIRSMKLR